MLLQIEVIEQVAHRLLKFCLYGEKENGLDVDDEQIVRIANRIIIEDRPMVMLVMGNMIGAIGEAWGHDVGLVFHHMGILDDEEETATVLYRLILGCFGHGTGIGDDHSVEFDRANEILSGGKMEESPTDFDQNCDFHDELLGLYYGPPELVADTE